jgi:predicted negative regulator of RcsB-dependent stress response
MATQLDLQEQEQIDALKAFWKQYGNLITWVLVLCLGAYAAWNGWNWYQRDQAGKAAAMFDELERAARAGDAERVARIFGDLRERYARTAFAQHGGLAAAKVQADKGKPDDARASLAWVAAHAVDDELRSLAHLRAAGLLLDAKKPEEALKELDGAKSAAFAPLVADRRGDALVALGRKAEAVAAYQEAHKALDEAQDYRRVIDAKLTAAGAAPVPAQGASR